MGYPFPYGYCQISDVEARINAGSWDATRTGARPSVAQVDAFIGDGATQIDLTLGKRGYTIPLTPAVGQTISPLVFALLQQINAALATAAVERTRHGSEDENEDSNASYWMTWADDMLARLEDGADNLTIFGVAGTFEPQADQSLAVSMGSTYEADGTVSQPMFTRFGNPF
jgi:hypothetical protein